MIFHAFWPKHGCIKIVGVREKGLMEYIERGDSSRL
jgi:hypothetical protein